MASYITVSALNNYLKRKFEADIHLNTVYLKGEISNCKIHSRGHIYFSLKDDTSVISAIMFQTNAKDLSFEPKEGVKVFATGKVSVYEATGKYQIVVSKMIPDGIGALYIKYEKLKKDLEKEGLFDKKYKKPLPRFPKKIGVVTAPTGAAIRDILTTIKRRYPISEVILFPTLVQGENAKESIVKQIGIAQNFNLDVLIVGRGGGSIEDLWAFNEEIVARAIFASKIPVVSAVGHEVDFTIADFVADYRAPTPTAAAEVCVPNMVDIVKLIDNFKIRLNENIRNKINLLEKHLDSLKSSYVLKNPETIYEIKEQNLTLLMDKLNNILKEKINFYNQKINFLKSSYILNNPNSLYVPKIEKLKVLEEKLNSTIKVNLNEKKKIYETNINKLELLNPLSVLKKGYSVVTMNDKSITSYKKVKKKDKINIKLNEGVILAEVLESRKD